MRFVTNATPMDRNISKHSQLAQLVIQVQYHMNVIYNLGGRHTNTHTYYVHEKKVRNYIYRCASAIGWHMPGLKGTIAYGTYMCIIIIMIDA